MVRSQKEGDTISQDKAPSSKLFTGVLLIAAIVAIALLLLLSRSNSNSNSTSIQDNTTCSTIPIVEKNPDSIAIPGYEILELKAGSTEQTLCMPNPPQNCCYFQISLYLEDETLLWKSELIEPGANSNPVVLSKALDKGRYPNAILRYSCYRMDENLSPLNGAEAKLTLWVK